MPGNGGGNQMTPEIKARTADRERRILILRVQGFEFEDIGQEFGISKQAAHRHYHRALRRIPEKEAKAARTEELIRLDILRRKFYGRLSAPEVVDKEPIGSLLLKIEQREARLLGLDAPTKVEQTKLEDPAVAARRERQMEILDKLTIEERQELLAVLGGSKGTPDGT